MTVDSDNGLVNVPSNHSVEQTVQNVERILQAKGVKLFALIDHSGEAALAWRCVPLNSWCSAIRRRARH